ncbi:MAG: ABC transporter substrate-binding protein [Parvibaculaceae bacterium]
MGSLSNCRPSRRTVSKGLAASLLAAPAILGTARAAAPLKIGCLAPVSGFFAREGQNCKRGFDLAGPMMSDMGMPVEILFADTESNPDRARTAAERLVGEGVQVLIGTFDSGETSAVAQVAEQKGIPHVINIAAAPQITEQGYKFVFRNFPTGPMLVRNGFALIKKLIEATEITPRTAVFMHVDDTFGTAMQKGVAALFPKLEMPFALIETISYDAKAKDLSVEVAKAKATDADLLLMVSHGADAIMLVREMVKQRWEPMGVMTPGSPGTYEAQFYKALGKYSDFIIANLPWINPTTAMSKDLLERFGKIYADEIIELNVGFSLEAVLIAADAHKRANSGDPKEIAEALRKTDIAEHVMIGGPIRFDEKGQNISIESAALQNLNRKPTVVLPQEAAEASPILPFPGWSDERRG